VTGEGSLLEMPSTCENKLRIAFSGGGFRATFYSLGAFRRLVELGLGDKVCRIDSVSGGSITAGQIMLALSSGPFKDTADFDRRVSQPLRSLGQSRFRERISFPVFGFVALASLAYLWLVSYFKTPLFVSLTAYILLLFYIRPAKLFGVSCLFMLNAFFKNKLMRSLPASPEWSANATCLNTGKRFRFKQKDFGGDKIGLTQDNDIKISFAVACSAAAPPVFTPYRLSLGKRKFFNRRGKENLFNPHPPAQVFLCDGGIYDNLGSESILQEENTENQNFIVVDAGQYIPQWFPNLNPHSLENTSRVIETAVDQIILLRRRILYGATQAQKPSGTILILEEPVKDYLSGKKCEAIGKTQEFPGEKLPAYDIFPEEIDKMIAGLRTDLDSFHDIEIDLLTWAGAVRMDIALKRYFKEYLRQDQINDLPVKPSYDQQRMIEILTRGRRFSVPFGFLHKRIKEK